MTKDNFSTQANLYAKYRPHYPQELYQYIFDDVSTFDRAWDCATGNGQVASVLSMRFNQVFATDISQKQVDKAVVRDNIQYSIGSAEKSNLHKNVDLITVGQAIHWFDIEGFYKEVKRLSKPSTILAFWGYELMTINSTIDPLILHFYNITLDGFWDPERKLLERSYQDIKIPLNDLNKKSFIYSVDWGIDHLAGYLSSWSSVQKYIRKYNKNPVEDLIKQIQPFWGETQTVNFPIFLTLGRVR